jgi:hypothetical protein
MPSHVSCELAINAPIDVVWAVMLDLESYADWNPFVVHVACARPHVAVGDVLRLHVRWSDGGEARSREQVTEIRSPRLVDGASRARLAYCFRGTLHALRLVRGKRTQSLEQTAPGPTLYRSEESFQGALVSFVPLAKVQDGFERHARALKARAESMARA